ncbi:hypothetical protein J1605_010660 [Eschrichtius robustus]|uniref:Uncharacterized protein n=1 Tax=Eschrichtius robustus TaxID=9764 RepID=A0AB34GSD9_ESCRO|nr:hypothetical protein J1605_010660 [Eschrichtius robustus]
MGYRRSGAWPATTPVFRSFALWLGDGGTRAAAAGIGKEALPQTDWRPSQPNATGSEGELGHVPCSSSRTCETQTRKELSALLDFSEARMWS